MGRKLIYQTVWVHIKNSKRLKLTDPTDAKTSSDKTYNDKAIKRTVNVIMHKRYDSFINSNNRKVHFDITFDSSAII